MQYLEGRIVEEVEDAELDFRGGLGTWKMGPWWR